MITGNYKMKFVGRPNGVLMKNAPGNFIHGQIYTVPYGHAKWPFWELLETPPVLKVETSDESFEEAYFVPEDDVVSIVTESAPVEEITMTPSSVEGYNFDPTAPATIEPYVMFNTGTGLTSPVDPEDFLEPTVEPEASETDMLKIEIARLQKALEEAKPTPPSRKELLAALADAGVEVKKGTRTTTLRKLVDNLEDH